MAAKGSDNFYNFDEEELNQVRKGKPWMSDPRYFKRVHISACAAMKMMSHAVSGVEKGLAAGGKPIEVMGLLLGRPSIGAERNSFVVTDSFALPIEGFETKVVADDQQVLNFMIELSETLELTRKEKFMGWYHSHPFDVEVHSHCYLSTTDVQTQLHWQRSEDNHGNPWLGIVIDPLHSLAKGRPTFGAFRAFPPEYSAPPNMTPDGSIVTDNSKIDKWGAAWNRYHSLEITYFMSTLSSQVSSTISQNFLWKNALSTTPVQDREYRDRLPERIHGATEKLEMSERNELLPFRSLPAAIVSGSNTTTSSSNATTTTTTSTSTTSTTAAGGSGEDMHRADSLLDKVSRSVCDISVEQCQGFLSQSTKKVLFG